jgi:hypothetical protein
VLQVQIKVALYNVHIKSIHYKEISNAITMNLRPSVSRKTVLITYHN